MLDFIFSFSKQRTFSLAKARWSSRMINRKKENKLEDYLFSFDDWQLKLWSSYKEKCKGPFVTIRIFSRPVIFGLNSKRKRSILEAEMLELQ